MATVNVLYNVGTRDESRTLTGMAHLFEHLMFGGSINVPSFDGELESVGGHSNAWTSPDFTNFYDILPACSLATAFHLESDRMLALAFSHRALEVQRSVVIEEFKQTHLNAPYGDFGHHMRRILYAPEHPYSWPTIGLEPAHIAAVSDEDVRRWFYSHYAPDNAVLSVVAPQPVEEIEELAKQWFGDIPARNIAPRSLPAPGFPMTEVEEWVTGDVPQTRIVVAFPMSAYGTTEYFAADSITDILSYGRAGRLQRRLMTGDHASLFSLVDASIMGSEHEGVLMLSCVLAQGRDSEDDCRLAVQLMRNELAELAKPGNVGDHELRRVLNNYEAGYRFEGAEANKLAFRNAQALMHGETPDYALEAHLALTPEIIQSAAAEIIGRPPAILYYRPTPSK